MARMFLRVEIRLEDETDAHGVASLGRRVHGRPVRILPLRTNDQLYIENIRKDKAYSAFVAFKHTKKTCQT